jgi:CBS domain-containing protein
MKNTFAENIVDFLKQYDPFKTVQYSDLLDIASQSEIIYLEKSKRLFKINDELHKSFYIVNSGIIHLTKIVDAQETLVSKCYVGSIFGLRPFFAKNNYSLNSIANEDAVVYAIPIVLFKPLLAKYAVVMDYFLESFSEQTKSTGENYQNLKAISEAGSDSELTDFSYFQELDYDKNPLLVPTHTNISTVAKKMVETNKSYAIVTNNARINGLITDADFRKKIAFGIINLDADCTTIMQHNVTIVEESISVAEAQLLLLKNETDYLCVTEDGTENTRIKGMISERDIIKSQSNNPGVLIDEIRNAKNFEELKYVHSKYLFVIQNSFTKNIPIFHINNTAGGILHSIIQQCIKLCLEKLGSPPARFVWLALGSQARKEQLVLSDQDSLIVYEDVAAEKHRDVKFYFVQLAKMVISNMEVLGYKPCPFEHLASNIKWCKSLSDFTAIYSNCIKSPGENMSDFSGIFFDFEYIYGEIKIKDSLEIAIHQSLANNKIFFDYIGNQLLKSPAPLTFFKKFAVEETGIHKDQFNLKQKGLQFYIDAARIFALSHNLKGVNNTFLRFKQMAITDPKNAEKYLDFAENYIKLQEFRAKEGILNDNDGAFIDTTKLSKIDKEELKKSLTEIDDIIDLIKDKYKLTRFS